MTTRVNNFCCSKCGTPTMEYFHLKHKRYCPGCEEDKNKIVEPTYRNCWKNKR